MSKTYVIFLANGQSFDVHNVHSVAYTGAEGHQKNMMLSDPEGNILAVLSENHHGLLYKRPTEPGEAPRFPVAAPAPEAVSEPAPYPPMPVAPGPDVQLSVDRHAENARLAQGYSEGYTRGQNDRAALGYDSTRVCPYASDNDYWQRQGWGDGYHQRGFHVPQR